MSQAEVKHDTLPDLDDLLQCPVCYEIPSGQIFQCNEGHHVCGRCKMRLEVCPVCRALFFGTRNYAMEELIANVKNLRAFKLGGKVTTDITLENSVADKEETSDAPENESENNEDSDQQTVQPPIRTPLACKGLFRCLSCKDGNGVRLPAARLLNHLRYFHSPELIEGKSENGEYVQIWQFSTTPGRIVIAVRVADMGIFFLIIEISHNTVYAWLTMASAPIVANEFNYTVTVSGNDREAIFSDCVWSVRTCEGFLKKRGHCLLVNGLDACALTAPVTISCKLTVRRSLSDQLAQQTQPRAVLRIANRANSHDTLYSHTTNDLEPFLQDLQNDVARLAHAFETLGRDADAMVNSEPEIRPIIINRYGGAADEFISTFAVAESQPVTQNNQVDNTERAHMSRSARRRMRNRLRATLQALELPEQGAARAAPAVPRQAQPTGYATPTPPPPAPVLAAPRQIRPSGHTNGQPLPSQHTVLSQPLSPASHDAPPSSSGLSNGLAQHGNPVRNKKKRRQRR